MPEWFVKFISDLKPSAITSCGVMIVCSLLLFMPHDLIVFLSLQKVIEEHRAWIGIAWLVSTSFCTIYFFKMIAPPITELTKRLCLKRSFTKILRNLTVDQKALLTTFKLDGWREHRLDRDSAVVDQLINMSILTIPDGHCSPLGINGYRSCRCYVDDWAREYLDKHPDYLGLSPKQISKE